MLLTAHAQPINKQVAIITTARLHLGFFDLTGTTGRRFGGLGLAIDAPSTQINVTRSEKLSIDAKSSDNVAKIVENFIKLLDVPDRFTVQILQSIPEHVGLGSGTQMALAIGAGLNQLFGLNLSVAKIAAIATRGKRSGIGIGAFEQGGFLLDTGKCAGKAASDIPVISARLVFPDDWRVLLVQDANHKGLHGATELQAFQSLPVAKNSLRDMVQAYMMPALQRSDLLAFGACMQDLQAYNGDYFAPVQGGRYASQDVAEVLSWLQTSGAPCVGQSSWGPTGFAILQTAQQAESLKAQAQVAFKEKTNISFQICRGKNTGASILES